MTTRPAILLVGAGGQVGYELRTALAGVGEVVATTRSGDADALGLDLEDGDAIGAVVERTGARIVVNAAAYTAVDRAEDEPERAARVNARAPALLAAAAARTGALLVHYSTDYVFDGAEATPRVESDPTAPVNVYGETKLAGEHAVRGAGGPHLVLRTSWVYAARGRNFPRAILERARGGEPLRVVDDQHGAPTSARWLAEATVAILARAHAEGPDWVSAHSGLYHLAAGGETTWCGFARRLLELTGHAAVARDVVPIATAAYPTRARRPRYTVLDCTRACGRLGAPSAPWDDQLAAIAQELAAR